MIANLTKVWGAHASKAGFYFQNSFKPQSIFASFNSQIDFRDNSSNPFDTGFSYANAATGVFNIYTQASKFAIPEWRYQNVECYVAGQLEGEEPADARLRRALLLPDPAVGHDAAGVEFPAGPVRLRARPRSSTRRSASAARRARVAPWDGPTLIAATRPDVANTVDARFIGRAHAGLESASTAAFQAGQGINDQLQNGNAFKVSPRIGVVYDVTGKARSSSAAASASSTTGRRATWCST